MLLYSGGTDLPKFIWSSPSVSGLGLSDHVNSRAWSSGGKVTLHMKKMSHIVVNLTPSK